MGTPKPDSVGGHPVGTFNPKASNRRKSIGEVSQNDPNE
jgi:hypothetical protein